MGWNLLAVKRMASSHLVICLLISAIAVFVSLFEAEKGSWSGGSSLMLRGVSSAVICAMVLWVVAPVLLKTIGRITM